MGNRVRTDRRGWAGHGAGRRTGGVGGRLAHQVRAASAADATGAEGNAGDNNGTICMTPVLTPAPPMVAPPAGEMSPSFLPGTKTPQIN